MPRKKNNRETVQNNQRRKKVSYNTKVENGTRQCMEEQRAKREEYKLDWFHPTEVQQEIVYSMIEDDLTLVSASSGCGKSTTVIWQALKELKQGNYNQIVFVKTPNESSDDSIGFLPSTADDKLAVHFEATKGIFTQFMSKAKLEMEEKRGNIQFKIPNFIQGATLDNTLLLIDEGQNISPPRLKLIMERVGTGSKIVVMGDKNQCYSHKKRENGFNHFVDMVTDEDEEGKFSKVPTIGYIEMFAEDNMRSDLSKLVVNLYEESL